MKKDKEVERGRKGEREKESEKKKERKRKKERESLFSGQSLPRVLLSVVSTHLFSNVEY